MVCRSAPASSKWVAEHVGIDTFLDRGATGGRGAGVVGSFGIGGVIAAVPAVAGK